MSLCNVASVYTLSLKKGTGFGWVIISSVPDPSQLLIRIRKEISSLLFKKKKDNYYYYHYYYYYIIINLSVMPNNPSVSPQDDSKNK
jgi:hypothetical protein